MNELQIFNNPEFGQVRAAEVDGEPWLVGKDVAEILGYSNPSEALQDHVDAEDKLNSKTLSSFELNLGQRGGWLINESGVYSLVFSSKLPDAKRFKHWVTHDVLPSIRKTGGYFAGSKELQAIFMLDSRTVEHEQRITALEGSMVIDYGQQRTLADLVNGTAVKALGGKDSAAYTDKSIRGKTYCEINRDLQRWFRVNSRNNIPSKRFDEAAEYIQRWHPNMNVAMLIRQANLQEVILEV